MGTTISPELDEVDADVAANADAHIVVNQAPRAPAPKFNPAPAPSSPVPTRRYGEDTLNNVTDEAPAPAASGGSHINWGQVIKGVAIVTAVVVAAAVVYAYAPGLIASGLNYLNTSPVFSPIIGALHSGAVWGIHALSEGATIASSFFSTLWGAVAPAAGSATALQATTAALAPAQIAAAGNALGVAATGGAVAAGVAVAAPAISHLHLVDHNTLTSAAVAPHDLSAGAAGMPEGATAAPDSSFANMLSLKKAALADALHQTTASNVETAHHAVDLAHHNTHDHASAEPSDAPDAPEGTPSERRTRANLLRAQKAQENWVDRVGSRSESFASQADIDAAKRETALSGPTA